MSTNLQAKTKSTNQNVIEGNEHEHEKFLPCESHNHHFSGTTTMEKRNNTKHLHVLFDENGLWGCDASHIVLQKFRFVDSDAHFIVKCLGQAITNEEDVSKDCTRFLAKEGIAGSSALLFLEQSLALDRNGNLIGRWRVNFWKTQDYHIFWQVNDIDYFIIADTKKAFLKRVREIVKAMSAVLKQYNEAITIQRKHLCLYVRLNTRVWIVDCKITGAEPTLSFVHANGLSSMKEVLDGFDMNIVKVMYDVRTMMLMTDEETIADVWNGEAAVSNFEMKSDIPSKFEIKKLSLTLNRMIKYGARGYKFRNYPLLQSQSRGATAITKETKEQRNEQHSLNIRRKNNKQKSKE